LTNALKINMNSPETPLKPRILIAPLDWGLGHATRCIPVIKTLLKKKCSVLIAAEGPTKFLLEKEFPQLDFVELKGYHINYSKNKWSLPFVIAGQIPKIISTIQYENQRLKDIVEEHFIEGIISDNRFGLYHKDIPSVFITHQLLIKTFLGNAADRLLKEINYKYINRFSECWVPDHASSDNLAGELSHPQKFPSTAVHYVGPLSRFEKLPQEQKHLLILLSGPEPQRTILENLFVALLKDYKKPVVLVRGLPGASSELKLEENVSVYNHLSANQLNKVLADASIVISRCGYSTVMDLALLHKKSILIPTPGQSEQEYLSRHLMKNNFALCIDQNKFILNNALNLAENFNYKMNAHSNQSSLETVIENFINRIKR